MLKGVLHPHQLDSLKWMASLHDEKMNGILADDMGLGKTIQAISLICYLHDERGIKQLPHLVIAPKSTMSNWMLEFGKWAPHLKTVQLIPTLEFREQILKEQMVPGEFDVCVTTYEALRYVP
jgi:SWI/SNF-related matrix-associated actin-dependent regulator of chromatin subfamily A member 5